MHATPSKLSVTLDGMAEEEGVPKNRLCCGTTEAQNIKMNMGMAGMRLYMIFSLNYGFFSDWNKISSARGSKLVLELS